MIEKVIRQPAQQQLVIPAQSTQPDLDTSEDEELTDDEVFLKRHLRHEQEEVKRYNIGIKSDKKQA